MAIKGAMSFLSSQCVVGLLTRRKTAVLDSSSLHRDNKPDNVDAKATR